MNYLQSQRDIYWHTRDCTKLPNKKGRRFWPQSFHRRLSHKKSTSSNIGTILLTVFLRHFQIWISFWPVWRCVRGGGGSLQDMLGACQHKCYWRKNKQQHKYKQNRPQATCTLMKVKQCYWGLLTVVLRPLISVEWTAPFWVFNLDLEASIDFSCSLFAF